MQKSDDQQKLFQNYGSAFVLILVAMLVGYLFHGLVLPRMDFYNELWGPAYLLVHGMSPYDTAVLHPNLPAAWLPMSIGFFFPLGWLSEEPAALLWYFLNVAEICAIIYLVVGARRNILDTAIISIFCFFFPLTLNHFNLGQFSITVTLCWVLVILLLEKEQTWASAFFASLALSKPHLGILILIGWSYRDFILGGARRMLFSWLRIIAMCLILCIPLFVAFPGWIPDAISSMGKNPPWSYPSLYILFERFFGNWGHFLWMGTTLIVMVVNVLIWSRLDLKRSVIWSLALAPLVTPYVGSWDFVILFPLLIFTYTNLDWKYKILFLAAYGIAWYGMARIQLLEVSHNHYFWWVPLWFIGVSGLLTYWKPRREN